MSEARPYQHLYGAEWRRQRREFLGRHLWCVLCRQLGKRTRATVVDHIQPHRGNPALFWSQANWQPLCRECHDRHKAAQERGGRLPGCDIDGVPLDSAHHWHGAGVGAGGKL